MRRAVIGLSAAVCVAVLPACGGSASGNHELPYPVTPGHVSREVPVEFRSPRGDDPAPLRGHHASASRLVVNPGTGWSATRVRAASFSCSLDARFFDTHGHEVAEPRNF